MPTKKEYEEQIDEIAKITYEELAEQDKNDKNENENKKNFHSPRM